LKKRAYFGLISYGYLRVLRQYFAVQKLSSCSLPSAYSTERLHFLLFGKQGCQTSLEKKSQTMSKKSQTLTRKEKGSNRTLV